MSARAKFKPGDMVLVGRGGFGRPPQRGTVALEHDGESLVMVTLDGKSKPRPFPPSHVRHDREAAQGPTPSRARAAKPRPSTTKPPQLRPVPKPPGPYRSPEYLAFVASKPCMALRCGAPPPSDPHHVTISARGMGQKVDDTCTVPLCREHHDQLHRTRQLPGLDVTGTRIALLRRQVELLTEWTRARDERERGEETDAR